MFKQKWKRWLKKQSPSHNQRDTTLEARGESGRCTYFERRRGGGADPGRAAAAAAAWVWLCAWWDSLAPACFGSLGGTGSQSPVSQSGLISQMQGIHSLCEARREKEEGEGRRGWGGGEKRREKERGEWMKQSCLAPRVLSIPAHFWHTPTQPRLELTEDRKSLMCSQGMFWQFSKWNSHFTQRVCTCAWEGVRRRVQATEREREKPPRWKGELIWFCLHSSGHERQLNALHNMSTFQVHLRSAAISVSH